MTYFNPEIYNKYNLSPRDRKEIDFWERLMDNALASARDDYEYKKEHDDNPLGVGIALKQLEAIDNVENELVSQLQDVIISYIDNYDDAELEKYKAAGDKERKEKGIVFEKPFASLKAQRDNMQGEMIDAGDE